MSAPNDINDAQYKAISHQGQHLLIVAGPGTGKTHTLTYKIARTVKLLKQDERILAITFTNKAADQMQQRLKDQLALDQSKIFVGTFHSFCADVLRSYMEEAGLVDGFRTATPEEIEDLIKTHWSDKTKSEQRNLLKEISHWKSTSFCEDIPTFVAEYNALLKNQNWLDFDDLLLCAEKLFRTHPKIKQEFFRKYPFVFVDEYQDINGVQHALLKLLVGEGVKLTAIGDPNQAIYGFRGSDVTFFKSFEDDFDGATKLSLSMNYRSAPNILQASTQVIEKSIFEVPELTAHIYSKGQLTVYAAPTEKAEAEYVVHNIERMVGGTSMFSQDSGRVDADQDCDRSFGDIAVIYRLNVQRKALELAFHRSGIPYQVSGDKSQYEQGSFMQSAEKVNLLTIHAAKGLEFPVVFIVGCEQNLLPLDVANLSSNLEEERRLFYVGMTRAKEQLFLLRSERRRIFGKMYHNEPSPFLNDIEEQLKEYAARKKYKEKKKEKQLSLFS